MISNFVDFNNFKVINGHEVPLYFYHWTNDKFDKFDLKYMGWNFEKVSKLGIYFTQYFNGPYYGSTAKEYAENAVNNYGGEPLVYKCILNFKNPLFLNSYNYYNSNAYVDKNHKKIKEILDKNDYDSVVCYNFKEERLKFRDYIAVVLDVNDIEVLEILNINDI